MASIADKIAEVPELTSFLNAVEKAEVLEALSLPGEFTVFAPSNDAFKVAPQDIIEESLKIIFNAKRLVTHHVVLGSYPNDVLLSRDRENLDTVARTSLRVTDEYGVARIAGAKLVTSDIKADNGILHIIERVLLPVQALSD